MLVLKEFKELKVILVTLVHKEFKASRVILVT